jgi:hypothetical protein
MGRRAKANAKVLDLAKGTEMPVTASRFLLCCPGMVGMKMDEA